MIDLMFLLPSYGGGTEMTKEDIMGLAARQGPIVIVCVEKPEWVSEYGWCGGRWEILTAEQFGLETWRSGEGER
jgi:hypothetical protein